MSSERVRVAGNGHIVIPTEYRQALGIRVGDDLIITLEAGEMRITTIQAGIRRAQELVCEFVPPGRSLADELVAERRAEAERE